MLPISEINLNCMHRPFDETPSTPHLHLFIRCNDEHSVEYITTKSKVLLNLLIHSGPLEMAWLPGAQQPDQEKFQQQEWPSTFSFRSADTSLPSHTAYSKLPFEVVGSLKACKPQNSTCRCLKPSCLNDINSNINVGDGAKGTKENSSS